jgi:hypothetical protein
MFEPAVFRRYSTREFPPYRHIPGSTPHPTRDPDGHSFGDTAGRLPDLNHADWRGCESFLYGIDLFNAGYWWEAHEVLEGLWHAAGIGTPAAHVLQAIIQCAAAHLKTATGRTTGARRLFEQAHKHVLWRKDRQLGLDLVGMLADTGAYVTGDTDRPARLVLLF